MNSMRILTSIVLLLSLTASISECLEQFIQYPNSDSVAKLVRVKRKGGKGGGGRSRSSSRGRGSKPKSDPYPKQPPYNPSYNPSAAGGAGAVGAGAGGAYPKQPGYNPGQQHNYPGQQNYPGQHNYPGQTGYGHGTNYGNMGGMGGMGLGTGLAGAGMKSKSGLGGLGAGVAGGALGAAVGAYGGYQLGKMVGGLGRGGHYGYYDQNYRHVKCDPPPRIETDPTTNITYIPRTVTYDARCEYYDRQPPRYYPGYERWGTNGGQQSIYHMSFMASMSSAVVLTLIIDFTNYSFISLLGRKVLSYI